MDWNWICVLCVKSSSSREKKNKIKSKTSSTWNTFMISEHQFYIYVIFRMGYCLALIKMHCVYRCDVKSFFFFYFMLWIVRNRHYSRNRWVYWSHRMVSYSHQVRCCLCFTYCELKNCYWKPIIFLGGNDMHYINNSFGKLFWNSMMKRICELCANFFLL